MEWLQWGFPIATALSSNTPTSINRKEKAEAEALATDEHGSKKRMDPRLREDDKSAVRGPTPG